MHIKIFVENKEPFVAKVGKVILAGSKLAEDFFYDNQPKCKPPMTWNDVNLPLGRVCSDFKTDLPLGYNMNDTVLRVESISQIASAKKSVYKEMVL